MAVTEGRFEEQFKKLMDTIEESKGAVEAKMEEFKKEIKESQEKTAESVAKKVRQIKAPDFKKKGNEIQYGFNEQVVEKLEEASSELDKLASTEAGTSGAASAVDKVKDSVKQGMELLTRRQHPDRRLVRVRLRCRSGI